MASVQVEMEGYRFKNMRRVVDWLADNGPLRVDPGLAAETMWAVASPDVGRLLCEERGWTQDQHAAWLEDVLARTLLPDAQTRRSPRD